MDCPSPSLEPTSRLIAFNRWIAASFTALLVVLATTDIALHLPHARVRHASRAGHGHARHPRGADLATRPTTPGAAPVRSTAAGSAVVALLLLTLVHSAGATTFVVGDDRDLLDASDLVIVGDVDSVRDVDSGDRIARSAQVRVLESLRGDAPSQVTVHLPGGRAGARRHIVFGAPDLRGGERALLFLRRRADGTFSTAQLALGKFSIVGEGRQAVAVRNLRGAAVLRQDGGRLLPRRGWDIRRLVDLAASLRGEADGATSPEPALPPAFTGTFTYLSSTPARWYEADDGLDLRYQAETVDGGGEHLQHDWALSQASEAWSRVDCSTAHPSIGGGAVVAPFDACDGRSQILFDDPLDELDPPIRCGGVVGVGGFCSVNGDRVVGGVLYDRITEGDVVINKGFDGCPFWNETNLSEILTHETGHTLGLGHSSEVPGESDPRLADAVMYFRAHLDGRGAAVMEDDRDGICTLYPRSALHDGDGDGVADGVDDCPNVTDPAQEDHDGDGLGDLCDPLTMGPGILRPSPGGSRVRIAAVLRPAAPFDFAHRTLTISILAGRNMLHQLVLTPDAWSRSSGSAFAAWSRAGSQRELVRIQLEEDGSYKLRLRARGVLMERAAARAAIVRIESGDYVGAGALRDGQ